MLRYVLERFTVSRKRRIALTLCFDAIPKGKRYALFPGKPLHTFPGIALAAALALSAAPALANDSVAELGTGGLILSRSDAVAMQSEDLFISPEKVTVDYVFHNNTDKDAIVAFPLPDAEEAN